MKTDEIELGLIRLYVLHCAALAPVAAVSIADQLQRRELKVSAGSVSRILSSLEAKGYVRQIGGPKRGDSTRTYRTTARGQAAVQQARRRIRDLAGTLD